VLNTIIADTLSNFKKDVDVLIEKGEKKEIALLQIIQKYIVESKSILFEGDGYSAEWEQVAEKRGLPNIKTTPLALDAFVTEKSKKLFTNNKIYSHSELEARHEILLENYVKKVQIEARVMGDLATNHILPAAIKYQNILIENIKGLKEIGLKNAASDNQVKIVNKISEHVNLMSNKVEEMIEARKKANEINDTRKKAIAYCDTVKTCFDAIRYNVDKLELLVDDKLWELPKYRELLFLR
jgi:glutamine synthetase